MPRNLTPNPFPPLPNPLLKGEGSGKTFFVGRGVSLSPSRRMKMCALQIP